MSHLERDLTIAFFYHRSGRLRHRWTEASHRSQLPHVVLDKPQSNS